MYGLLVIHQADVHSPGSRNEGGGCRGSGSVVVTSPKLTLMATLKSCRSYMTRLGVGVTG